jgi:hypothetical protein
MNVVGPETLAAYLGCLMRNNLYSIGFAAVIGLMAGALFR